MKSICALTLLWTLFSTGRALDCQTCLNVADPQCTSQASLTCATETMCVTATTLVNVGGNPSTIVSKQCASPTTCPSTGTLTFTVNVGLAAAVTTAQCCNTDNCNSLTLPEPSRNTTANGLQCNFCLPNTDLCSIIIDCEGNEDRCFSGRVTGGTIGDDVLGCVSTNICDSPSNLGLQLFQNLGTFTSGPTCCNTALCNERTTDPPTTTTSPSSPSSPRTTPNSTATPRTTSKGTAATQATTGGSVGEGVTSTSGGSGGSGVTDGSSLMASCVVTLAVALMAAILVSTR